MKKYVSFAVVALLATTQINANQFELAKDMKEVKESLNQRSTGHKSHKVRPAGKEGTNAQSEDEKIEEFLNKIHYKDPKRSGGRMLHSKIEKSSKLPVKKFKEDSVHNQ